MGVVIGCLTRGQTYQEAANAAGVTRQCIWGWMKDPVFRDKLEEAQESVVEAIVNNAVATAVRDIRELSPLAIKALEKGVRHKSPGVYLKAAESILKRVQEFETKQLVEVTGTMEDRIQRYEDWLRAVEPKPTGEYKA